MYLCTEYYPQLLLLILMANVIKIKKGLNIRLQGEAPKVDLQVVQGDLYGVVPDHYPGFLPKLLVQAGDRVLAGTPVMYHKNCPDLKITSPVSGVVKEIRRGAKRKILSVDIQPEATQAYESYDVSSVATMERMDILHLLQASGMLALIRQRPYDYVALPTVAPRDIFITANLTAPLAPDVNYVLKNDLDHIQLAVDALRKLTSGSVVMGVPANSTLCPKNCEVYQVQGAHPAGNVGVLINHVRPVNKGEVVWTLSITELILIGRFLATGKVDMSKCIALTGSKLETRGYVNVLPGCSVRHLVASRLSNGTEHVRIIDGDPLTGRMVDAEYDALSPYSNQITVIPEGDDVHELFGWAVPGFNKFSMSRTYPSFLTSKKYDIDARLRGGERAIIMSNEYDKVFPFDIYPEYLIKAIIAFDIDKMESLGIYEVAPEDFAVCEFVDTSKLDLQYIVRKGLDLLYKEMN